MEKTDRYTVDSIAVLGYLADRLPAKADRVFKKAEDGKAELVVPSITLGETLFALLKGKEVFGIKIPVDKLSMFLDVVENSAVMQLKDLDVNGWRDVSSIELPELHDRMIVATHKQSDSVAIVTNDREISNLEGIQTIW